MQSCFVYQRARLEAQVISHAEKAARAKSSTQSGEGREERDEADYEVSLDDDFLTALEYGMPPAAGMVSSVLRSLALSLFLSVCIMMFMWHFLCMLTSYLRALALTDWSCF